MSPFVGVQIPAPVTPAKAIIVTSSLEAAGDLLVPMFAVPSGSTGWVAINRGYFIPFEVASPMIATQMLWVNGNVSSGNVDAGIYDTLGNRIVSFGGVAQGTVSVPQVVDITDTYLKPGIYYMGISLDNTTGRIARWGIAGGSPVVQIIEAFGLQEASSVYPLPNPVTFGNMADSYIPFVGVSLRSAAI